MLNLQLRPCYKIVYLGLKRRLLDSITPYTSEVLELEAAFNAPRQVDGEVTSGVLEDTTFDEAILHSTVVDIRAGTSTSPRPGDAVVSGRTPKFITFLTPRRGGVAASDFPGRTFARVGLGRGHTL